jgi:UDP-N-acetylglucosamine 2-epimerase (non-hydrolysing)/GDP/UDP-N,N'-diacetylbacillosamine 2-epimerase (hydrolysing)
MRRIAVVTGARAEFGLLRWLMQDIVDDPELELQVVVTGAHLAPELGYTITEVEEAFEVAAKVDMLLASDSAVAVTKSLGLGTIGMADTFARLRPDMLVLLGDRYEILAAASAALLARIPVAHLCGGDVTEGAFDESIRHAITKMAHLHFVTNAPARDRVVQMGENPAHVFDVGYTGLDHLERGPQLDRAALEATLGWSLRERNLLVTFHPETLGARTAAEDFGELVSALSWLEHDIGLVFTYPNADTEGRSLIAPLEQFVARHKSAVAFKSLGSTRYLALMREVDAVVGNSSSGLYEAPALGVPTVNIGQRQKGRLAAASVLTVACEADAIGDGIRAALAFDRDGIESPYGKPGASRRIVEVLKAWDDPAALVRKPFFVAGGRDG